MSKELYRVIIFRRDGNHLEGFESEDFDQAKGKWLEYQEQWVEKFKEAQPFILEEPVVTAFDPGLILEISVLPVQEQKQSNNPYKKQMQKEGLTNTLNSMTGTNYNLLDGGYN